MNITLGDNIEINGEKVPEFLLKALYENLKQKFEVPRIAPSAVTAGRITSNVSYAHDLTGTGEPHISCNCVTANKIQANGSRVNPASIRYF